MRKIILFIIFLIIIFIVNVSFYFLSEDYRILLKNIKNKDIIINIKESTFNDTINDENINNLEKVVVNKVKDDVFSKKEGSWSLDLKQEVSLWNNYLDIINLFSDYDINKLEFNSNLFDITNEYPDKYIEYYSKDLSLYLFPTKNYNDLLDIFKVLSYELPFTLNEANNFLNESFYINLNNDIEDRFIRIVISNKWAVFWLKIKKTEYDKVKQKLTTLINK